MEAESQETSFSTSFSTPVTATFYNSSSSKRLYHSRSSTFYRSARLLVICCIITSLWHQQWSLKTFVLGRPTSRNSPPFSSRYDPDQSHLKGQFLHITDIHPDEFYINGGTIASSCHRNATDDENNDGSHIFRPGRTEGGVGGLFGSPYSICDSPFSLTNATFEWIDKNLLDEIDFVVWTGDNARHDSDNERPRTQKQIEDMNREIANRFLEVFAPDKDDPFQQRIPIVPSIGNNDVYPHNIMEAGPNRILQHFSEIWAEFIPESQYHTFQHGGYYTAEVVPGKIAVVALNTLYFFNQNAAVDGCDSDDEPGTDQMDWLEVELESMRKRGMTAYLTGHVPPARKSYSDSCFIRYTDIALRFQDVIVGHLYGHANIDHFFILSQATLKGSEFELPSEEEIPHTEEPENSNTATVGFMGKNKSVCGDKSFEYEYDQFHYMGLSSYLLELWEQYEDIPKKKVKLSDYAIVLVSPSVVPTYNPSLRVYSYQLATEKSQDELLTVSPSEELDGSQAESFEDEAGDLDNEVEQEEEEESLWSGFVAQRYGHNVDNNYNNGKKKKKKPKKPKKPKRPPNPPAVPPSAFGFPLHYTQYWVNLTLANLEKKQPEYVVEYRSKEDWGLQDLSVPGWLALARKVVTDDRVKEQYLARMVVLTGTENDHF